jgi:hypothetical protein
MTEKKKSEQQDNKPFHYRLPVFSYILIWAIAFFLAQTVLTIFTLQSQAGNSYSDSVASEYTKLVTAAFVMLALGSLLLYAVASGKKVMRFSAIGLSLIMIACQAYVVVTFLGDQLANYSYVGFDGLWRLFPFFAGYIIDVALPIAIIIYMFLPKARLAYR